MLLKNKKVVWVGVGVVDHLTYTPSLPFSEWWKTLEPSRSYMFHLDTNAIMAAILSRHLVLAYDMTTPYNFPIPYLVVQL